MDIPEPVQGLFLIDFFPICVTMFSGWIGYKGIEYGPLVAIVVIVQKPEDCR